MKRSLSQTNLPSRILKHQISQQCIYINQQCPQKPQKKSMHTIFHSPFKNGRPNKQYSNPTFMTSDVIYNRQFNPFLSNTPKKAIIHTDAQNKQKALYNQRMNRSQSFTNISQRVRQNSKSIKKRVKLRGQQGKNTQVMMSTALQNELQGLVKYRLQRELKQFNRDPKDRYFRRADKKQKQLPVFLQNCYKNPDYQQQKEQKKRSQLRQWLGLSQELKQIKEQIKRQKHRGQVNTMSKNIEDYQVEIKKQQHMSKKNQYLLSKVLLQQIKTNERKNLVQKREKGWRVF